MLYALLIRLETPTADGRPRGKKSQSERFRAEVLGRLTLFPGRLHPGGSSCNARGVALLPRHLEALGP